MLDDFTSRIHYWSCNLLHLCRLSFHSQVFVMDVEVYIVELCCLLLFLVRKDLLWLHFISGINVTSFKSLILPISETLYTKFQTLKQSISKAAEDIKVTMTPNPHPFVIIFRKAFHRFQFKCRNWLRYFTRIDQLL